MGYIEIISLIFLGALGAVFGSFACCQAWRIHEGKLGSRSICLHCKKQLKWYDNIPVFSWLVLRGKCRFCKKPIGVAEILSETSLAATFVIFGFLFFTHSFPFQYQNVEFIVSLVPLVLLLVLTVVFWILMIYDAKWSEMPTKLLVAANVVAVLYFIAHNIVACLDAGTFAFDVVWQGALFETFLGFAILAGTYYLLYVFSKEKWVGSGDWIVCSAISIALGGWALAIAELFFANLLALICALPGVITKKQKQIPFAPFLIIAFVIVIAFLYTFTSRFLKF
ncbi:MAG: prepilin peptidase [Candidatus Saccharibacteria bacterium]|nr:prepilin peptidase [Candidatus Saccharibacteria bacterium]